MHPILASRLRLGLYLGIWGLVAVLLAVVYSRVSAATSAHALVLVVPVCLAYAFVCMGAWYVCRAIPLAPSQILRIVAAQLGSAAISAGLCLAVWIVWGGAIQEIYPKFAEEASPNPQLTLVFTGAILLFLLSSAVDYLLMAFETSRLAESRELGLEVLARDAELKALRAQIDPHFLFNSLHSISALVSHDPSGARRMCLLLADFFRSSLQLGAKDRITVNDELSLVRHYLEIEKVRFGARLKAEFAVDPACGTLWVPPLILQPLVENAVRHGINTVVEGGAIAIGGRYSAGYLTLSVENPLDPASPTRSGAGVGIQNVRSRLKTLFEHEATVHVVRSNETFRVELRFPSSAEALRALREAKV